MSWGTYTEYKSTGMNWLDSVPAHWNVIKLKYVSRTQFSSVDKHTNEGEEPIHLCNYVDVYKNQFITADLPFMEATATSAEIAKYALQSGDVLVTKDSEAWNDIAVAALVTHALQGTLCGYHLAQIRATPGLLDGRYLFRSFQARGVNDQFQVAATGITRYGLGKYSLDCGLFPLPPMPEQHQIAAFLDRETERIDSLIAKKQRQIELLNEKRAALIGRAVTKGLNPDARMKKSGIEWLGDIPGHWEVKRLKHIVRVVSKGTTPTTLGCGFTNAGIRFIKAENIANGEIVDSPAVFIDEQTNILLCRSMLQCNDVLIVIAGATTGKVAQVFSRHLPANTNQAVAFIRPLDGRTARFIFYWLSGCYIQTNVWLNAVQAAQPNLAMEDIRSFWMPCPPVDEMERIVSFLAQHLTRIEALLLRIHKSISKLQEYRIALITAAVTGKIDVRGKVLNE